MDTPASAPTDMASPAPSPSGPSDTGLRAHYSNSPQMFAEQPPPAPATAPTPAPGAGPVAEQTAQTEPVAEAAVEPAAAVDISAYADLALPEGFEVAPELMGRASQAFAKAGLSKAQAEAMVGIHADLAAEQERAIQSRMATVDAGWREEVARTVPVADLNAARQVVASAPADVKQLLNVTGLGNHPGLVRWIASLGRQLGGRETVPVDPFLRMYPSMREQR